MSNSIKRFVSTINQHLSELRQNHLLPSTLNIICGRIRHGTYTTYFHYQTAGGKHFIMMNRNSRTQSTAEDTVKIIILNKLLTAIFYYTPCLIVWQHRLHDDKLEKNTAHNDKIYFSKNNINGI